MMSTPLNMQADNAKDIFLRIGQLTRLLRDSMANLGLEQAIMEVADAFCGVVINLILTGRVFESPRAF